MLRGATSRCHRARAWTEILSKQIASDAVPVSDGVVSGLAVAERGTGDHGGLERSGVRDTVEVGAAEAASLGFHAQPGAIDVRPACVPFELFATGEVVPKDAVTIVHVAEEERDELVADDFAGEEWVARRNVERVGGGRNTAIGKHVGNFFGRAARSVLGELEECGGFFGVAGVGSGGSGNHAPDDVGFGFGKWGHVGAGGHGVVASLADSSAVALTRSIATGGAQPDDDLNLLGDVSGRVEVHGSEEKKRVQARKGSDDCAVCEFVRSE